MQTYKTKGIIIKRSNLFEADKLLTIYTENFGKIQVLAKGVKRLKSKLAGHLELFYKTNLVIHKGKNLDIIVGADLIDPYKNITMSRKRINFSYYIAELLCFSMGEEIINKKIFYLLDDMYKIIGQKNYQIAGYFFELKLFYYLGHYPEINKCVKCQSKIVSKINYFNFAEGGLVCPKCNNKNYIEADEKTVKLLKIIKNSTFSYFLRINFRQISLEKLKQCVGEIRNYVLERELKSERFL